MFCPATNHTCKNGSLLRSRLNTYCSPPLDSIFVYRIAASARMQLNGHNQLVRLLTQQLTLTPHSEKILSLNSTRLFSSIQ